MGAPVETTEPVRRLVGCLVMAILAGCGGPVSSEANGEHAAPIVEGQSSPSPSDDDSVVLLRTDASGTETICTGVLIAPNLVAPARHCVSYCLEGTFRCTVQGEAVDNPEGGGTLLGHFPADQLEIYALEVPE